MKELANRVVALGVVRQDRDMADLFWPITASQPIPRSRIPYDWRVAGALMEKTRKNIVVWPSDEKWIAEVDYDDRFSSKSLPKAIIEACCEALSDD